MDERFWHVVFSVLKCNQDNPVEPLQTELRTSNLVKRMAIRMPAV